MMAQRQNKTKATYLELCVGEKTTGVLDCSESND